MMKDADISKIAGFLHGAKQRAHSLHAGMFAYLIQPAIDEQADLSNGSAPMTDPAEGEASS